MSNDPGERVSTFWYDSIKMRGCGDPAEMLGMIRDELGRLDTTPGDSNRQPPPSGVTHTLLAYCLDSWGLTGRGTSLAWPWLTEEGRALLSALRSADLATALDE